MLKIAQHTSPSVAAFWVVAVLKMLHAVDRYKDKRSFKCWAVLQSHKCCASRQSVSPLAAAADWSGRPTTTLSLRTSTWPGLAPLGLEMCLGSHIVTLRRGSK